MRRGWERRPGPATKHVPDCLDRWAKIAAPEEQYGYHEDDYQFRKPDVMNVHDGYSNRLRFMLLFLRCAGISENSQMAW